MTAEKTPVKDDIGTRLTMAWGLRGTAIPEADAIAVGHLISTFAALHNDFAAVVSFWRDDLMFINYGQVTCPTCEHSDRVQLTDEDRYRGNWFGVLFDQTVAAHSGYRSHVAQENR